MRKVAETLRTTDYAEIDDKGKTRKTEVNEGSEGRLQSDQIRMICDSFVIFC
jgi:hypothetical protein